MAHHDRADRWAFPVGAWTVVGLDAQLMGSGLAEEDEQATWLGDTVAAAGREGRRVAVALHKPLLPPPRRAADVNSGRYVPPCATRNLLAALTDVRRVSLVVSGHTHQFTAHRRAGVTYVWAPTTWAVLPPRWQPALGDRAAGVVDLRLADDGAVGVRPRVPRGLAQHMLDETVALPRHGPSPLPV